MSAKPLCACHIEGTRETTEVAEAWIRVRLVEMVTSAQWLRKIYFEGKGGMARLLSFSHRKPVHQISLLTKTSVMHSLAWVPWPLGNYPKMSVVLEREKAENYLVTSCFYSFIHSCIPSSPHSLYRHLFSIECLSRTMLSLGGEA